MSGADIAAEATAGIREGSAETGNGTPLVGAIIRTSGADETTYPPTPGTETEYTCSVMLSSYRTQDRNGTEITAQDVKVLIAKDAETDPRNGDSLRVAGQTFNIVNVEAIQPGGEVIMWKAQVRGANG